MADFNKAILKVLRHEGVHFDGSNNPIAGRTGYVNHPDDPGGETNYGVTLAVARQYGYSGPMQTIPFDIVKIIYRRLYWDKMRGDEMPDQQIAEEVFDTGVNCGMPVTVMFLQRTLNVLNKQEGLYRDIAADGVCGSGTINALKTALAVQLWYRDCILRALDSLQCVRYIELAERNKKFETFVPGWLRTRIGGY